MFDVCGDGLVTRRFRWLGFFLSVLWLQIPILIFWWLIYFLHGFYWENTGLSGS